MFFTESVCEDYDGPTSLQSRKSVVSSEFVVKSEKSTSVECKATALEKYMFIPNASGQFREYQYELAIPGLSGLNYIICAPTGSGKTMVAGCIIANQLQSSHEKKEQKMILFMVDKVHLATQQKESLEKYIYDAKFMEITGQESDTSRSILLSLSLADVFVCTAGFIEEKMKFQDDLDITSFSLIVIDECHHTLKNHPYARIMKRYLALKMSAQDIDLPQIVGLTASPAAGGGMNIQTVRENLLKLCAQMDAVSGIHIVKKNEEELNRHTNKPLHDMILCESRKESEPSVVEVTDWMNSIEREILDGRPIPHSKTSQNYLSQIGVIQMDAENLSLTQTVTLNFLSELAKALSIYMDLEKEDMLEYLQKHPFPKVAALQSTQSFTQSKFIHLISRLQSLDRVTNPLLLKLESILLEEMHRRDGSKAIVIVETIQQAKSICKWISQRQNLTEKVTPRVVVGQMKGGMTKAEQISNISSLREGNTDLLVATSILEEGMDIPKCRLVVRYQHVSSEVARVQVEGRARDVNSKVYTILSSEKKMNQEYQNKERVQLVKDALDHIPCGPLLEKKIQPMQKDILSKQERQEEELVAKKSQHSGSDVEVNCKQCKELLCYGSDLRLFPERFVAVIEPTFADKIKSMEKSEHKCQSGLTRTDDIFCKQCDFDLGVIGHRSDAIPLYAVRCGGFSFKFKDKPLKTFKKWGQVPFNIEKMY